MPRFFISDENIEDKNIIIRDELYNHIVKSLRYKVNDKIEFSNNKNIKYECTVEAINKKDLICSIDNKESFDNSNEINVILYQSIIKGDKMDLIIQKAVELGVTKIVPVITDNTVVKFDNEAKKDAKVSRWNKIALEASR